MKLFKRVTYDRKQTFWQIGDTDYYLSEDKTELFLFEPYTADDGGFDVDLFECGTSSSTWKKISIDLEFLLKEVGERKEIIKNLKRHLKGIEKTIQKLEK